MDIRKKTDKKLRIWAQDLKKKVIEEKADLGIGFDGDGDRAGFVDKNGNEIKTLNTLKKILNENFELIHLKDIEFVIKESARKFQHTIAQCSIWKKR